MGVDISLDKYCTAALPIDRGEANMDPNDPNFDKLSHSESNEFMNEQAKKTFKSDLCKRASWSMTNSKRQHSSISSSPHTRKKHDNSHLDLPIQPQTDDDIDGDGITSSDPIETDHNKLLIITPSKSPSSKHRIRHKKRRKSAPTGTPSKSSPSKHNNVITPSPSKIIIPSSPDSNKIELISPPKSTKTKRKHRKKHRKKHGKSKKSKRRSSAMTTAEELEEYEIRFKQEQHEKDLLKEEIKKLREELSKYAQQEGVYANDDMHRSNFRFPAPPKLLNIESQPVTIFGDDLSIDGNKTILSYFENGSKRGSYSQQTNITPKTPSIQIKSINSRRSLNCDHTPKGMLSPLSPLSENQQNIILSFAACPEQ